MRCLLTRRDLAAVLKISSRSLDRFRTAGQILDPLPGPGRPRWAADEVSEWIETGRPCADVWLRLRGRRRR
jgi:hypothetical protein